MNTRPLRSVLLILAAGAAAATLVLVLVQPSVPPGLLDPSAATPVNGAPELPGPGWDSGEHAGFPPTDGRVAAGRSGAGGPGEIRHAHASPDEGGGSGESEAGGSGPGGRAAGRGEGGRKAAATGPDGPRYIRAGFEVEVAGVSPDALERRDPLPWSLLDYWPKDPAAWIDPWGESHEPVGKTDNPPVEIGAFWAKEPGNDPLKAERQGAFSVKSDRPADVVQGHATRLKGRVADAATGAGIGGASVVLFSTFYKPLVNYTHHLKEVAAATTGTDGAFSIPGFNVDDVHFGAAGKVFLTVSCPGYAALTGAWLESLTPGHENDAGTVLLRAGGCTVRGAVFDRHGRPVPGALVAFTGEIFPTEYSKDQRYAFLPRFPHAVCGADGAFEARGISGRQWVSVHVGPDCVTSSLMEFGDSGDRDGLLFRVLAGGKVDGKVVDAQDRPVADAVVSGGNNSTHSYADGSFCLENVEGDPLEIEVRHHLFRQVTVPNVPVGQSGLKIVLRDPLPRIVLKVLWEDSREPVTQVRVWFYMAGMAQLPGTPVGDTEYVKNLEGIFALVVPDGADHAVVTAEGAPGLKTVDLAGLRDGEEIEVLLRRP